MRPENSVGGDWRKNGLSMAADGKRLWHPFLLGEGAVAASVERV